MYKPERLKQCRTDMKISGEELCRVLVNKGFKISRQTLSSWENGDTAPTATQLAELAMFFGKPASYFFDLKPTLSR